MAYEKASQSFVPMDEIKSNIFFVPACTKRKIQIGLQVWNLSANSRQIMRVADLLAHRVSGGISFKLLQWSNLNEKTELI